MLNTHVSYPRGCMQSMGCVFLLRNGLGIRFEKKFCKLPHIVALHFKNINSQLCINFLFLFCIKRRNFGALRLSPKNTNSSKHLQEKNNGNPHIKLSLACFVMKNMHSGKRTYHAKDSGNKKGSFRDSPLIVNCFILVHSVN